MFVFLVFYQRCCKNSKNTYSMNIDSKYIYYYFLTIKSYRMLIINSGGGFRQRRS